MVTHLGNYDDEGRLIVGFPVETTEGETVRVSKQGIEGRTLLVAEDGRTFEPARSNGLMLVQEVTVMVDGIVDAVKETVEDVKEEIEDVKEEIGDVVGELTDGIGNDDSESEEPPAAA